VVDGVAWVAAENLHVTLKFLGGVDAARLALVSAALDEAVRDRPAFELVVAGLGAFPTPTRPRVIWAGAAAGAAALGEVAGRVDRALAALGFPPEERAFSPHITLGRVREPRRNERLADLVGRSETFGTVRVDRVCLMRSDLSPRGARYSEQSAHLLR
jgi:2'-5' RNA ligase